MGAAALPCAERFFLRCLDMQFVCANARLDKVRNTLCNAMLPCFPKLVSTNVFATANGISDRYAENVCFSQKAKRKPRTSNYAEVRGSSCKLL